MMAQVAMTTIGGKAITNLDCQFARWRKNKCVNRTRHGVAAVLLMMFLWLLFAFQYLYNRNGESCCFAGAGLSAAKQVAAVKHYGNGLLLNRCWFRISLMLKR